MGHSLLASLKQEREWGLRRLEAGSHKQSVTEIAEGPEGAPHGCGQPTSFSGRFANSRVLQLATHVFQMGCCLKHTLGIKSLMSGTAETHNFKVTRTKEQKQEIKNIIRNCVSLSK